MTEDSPSPIPASEICDGSDDVRLYVGYWHDDFDHPIFTYGLAPEGHTFLKIDGQCRYYVVPSKAPLGDVYTGTLTLAQVDDLSERLQTGTWEGFGVAELELPVDGSYNSPHAYGWTRFWSPRAAAECRSTCQGAAHEAYLASAVVIRELHAAGEPFLPDLLEFSVDTSTTPLEVLRWEGPEALSAVTESAWDARSPQDLGHFIHRADAPWLWDTRQRWVERHRHSPIAVAEGDASAATHELVVRAVTPPVWPSDVDELTQLGLWPR